MPHDSTHDMLVTIVAAISAGVILVAVARRLGLPSIVLLLVGGIALGPVGAGIVRSDSLGDGLLVFVALAVGLILFEGGLTLETRGYRSAPAMIKRLLTIGVLTTWLVTALALRLVVGVSLPYAIVAASLVIVTGPTVIAPMLKRVRVKARVHAILHWEGVLIDPLGVFIAVLCFEWVSGAGQQALANLGLRVAAGLAVGAAGGLLLALIVRRRLVPEDMQNVFVLAVAILIFGVAEVLIEEAGLLAVTAAGFIFGLSGALHMKQIRAFKAELTDLLIGTLFILLAARLEPEQFRTFGLAGAAVVAIVMLVVRPLSVLLCSLGLDLTGRERMFLSWVAPRGIVAASMASLFAISMERLGIGEEAGPGGARFIETFTYSVIVATIVLQGPTAGPLARALDLERPRPVGWLIIGAHLFARRIASFIARAAEVPVLLVDTNAGSVRRAADEGLSAVVTDARDPSFQDDPMVQGIGNVLALTDNEDLNVRLCRAWSGAVGSDHVFRCNPSGARSPRSEDAGEQVPGSLVWPKLPRPTLIAAELLRGDAILREAREEIPPYARWCTPLVSVDGGRVRIGSDPREDPERPAPGATLYLQRRADYLARALRPALVTDVDAGDLRAVLEHLVDRAITAAPALPRDETVADLMERETMLPSAIGHGVAVPHAYCPALDERLCALGRIKSGLDLRAHDGEPVRLVFLLLSPPGDPESHLATLAEIARTVHAEEVRERLLSAKLEEVPAILRAAQ